MHGLLADDMGVYKVDEQGRERYSFRYIDTLYDYILSIGMKPFVELGFMPSALAIKSIDPAYRVGGPARWGIGATTPTARTWLWVRPRS